MKSLRDTFSSDAQASSARIDERRAIIQEELVAGELPHYSLVRFVIAGMYSRGDSLEEIAELAPILLSSIAAVNRRSSEAGQPLLLTRETGPGTYQELLWALSLGVLLRADNELIKNTYQSVKPAGILVDVLSNGSIVNDGTCLHGETWKELCDAATTGPELRPALVKKYLEVWYGKKMNGMSWKNSHKTPRAFSGYWCFEAAGIVARLRIDDSSFRNNEFYPTDLVDFYRNQ